MGAFSFPGSASCADSRVAGGYSPVCLLGSRAMGAFSFPGSASCADSRVARGYSPVCLLGSRAMGAFSFPRLFLLSRE